MHLQLPWSAWPSRDTAVATKPLGSKVIVDMYGPLGHIVAQLERGVVKVHPVRVGEVIDAAAGFVDLVNTGRLSHMRDPRLDGAVAWVRRRKIRDRWGFSRAGEADISALVAASLGTWAVEADAYLRPRIY